MEIYNDFTEYSLRNRYEPFKSSPLVLYNQNELFTFSPLQSLMHDYINQTKKKYFKKQVCFRNLSPVNKSNPLALPLQTVFSLHNTEMKNHFSEIKSIIKEFIINKLKISLDNIYLLIPDIPSIKNELNEFQLIPRRPGRLKCAVPIDGKSYYISVLVHYRNGLISILNFALINYKNSKFQMDSIFFESRMKMIIEKVNFIFNTTDYSVQRKILKNYGVNKASNQHFLISQVEAFTTLYEEVGSISSKKHGHILKKLLKESILFCIEKNFSIHLLNDLTTSFTPHLSVEKEINYIKKNIETCRKQMIKKYSRHSYIKEEDVHDIMDTFGMPLSIIKKEFKDKLNYEIPEINKGFSYHFNDEKNIYTDPIIQFP